MDRRQPVPHGDVARLEDGPDLHGEGLAAGVALVEADPVGLALERAGLVHNATMRADAAIRPDPSLNIGIGGGFVIEVGGAENRLGHDLTPYESNLILVGGNVKYNIAKSNEGRELGVRGNSGLRKAA